MINIQKINDEVVKPIKLKKVDPKKIKGHDLFPELYCNIFLCARKKSGKTNVINKIIKACSDFDTDFFFFATTINKDKNLRKIVKTLKKKGHEVETYMDLKDGKVDVLKNIITELKEEESDSSSEEEEEEHKYKKKKVKFISVDGDSDDEHKRRKKYLAPDHFFVFDDLGSLLRNKNLETLLKTNRHYKAKVIVSSQYPNDLKPEAIKQMDFLILFGGHPEDKLIEFYKHADIPIDFSIFYMLYKHATSVKYSFLYIDVRNLEFRKNFNYKYNIK